MGRIRRDPFVLVLFGATGDLAKRKLYSALFRLVRSKKISRDFKVVGIARSTLTDAHFRRIVFESTNFKCNNQFLKKFFYQRVDMHEPGGLDHVESYLKQLKADYAGNIIFYLSLHPMLFENALTQLMHSGLFAFDDESRIAFEKPFGMDAASCKTLNTLILEQGSEEKVYRIDHYLNYKMVRNILAVRFSNHFFEKIWNKDFIDHVQIIANEKIGLEGRNAYFGDSGVLKDMFQTHLLQLASLVGIEEPDSLKREDLSKSKVDFLKNITLDETCFLVKGQYHGFCKDLGTDSSIETCMGLKLFVDNERWRGVPFYFKSGKGLDEKVTRIYIRLKKSDSKIFKKGVLPNSILITISGDEGVSVRFNVYHSFKDDMLEPVFMSFLENKDLRKKHAHPYDRLLYRVIRFDNKGFVTGEEAEACWAVYEQVMRALDSPRLVYYYPGSKGPSELFSLMRADGRRWLV
ncbi:hypothetical protein COT72_04450 [archaeon CG10_big_fil_rev_8_21_14_0_10_43_11]|nr:MAG: hypothetical protein COT72_04450 [archaeon CG10_big_fil_rev_8_21_14_0_10_43_11]